MLCASRSTPRPFFADLTHRRLWRETLLQARSVAAFLIDAHKYWVFGKILYGGNESGNVLTISDVALKEDDNAHAQIDKFDQFARRIVPVKTYAN